MFLDPQFPASYCLAFFTDTEYHHISAKPSFLPSCPPPFPPSLDFNDSHLPCSHCDSASTFSLLEHQPCPPRRSWMLARTTELSLKAWGFHKYLELLAVKKCLILIVCAVLKERGVLWFGWAVRNLKGKTMKPLHVISTLTLCLFYFHMSSLYTKSKILFRPFQHKLYFTHKSLLTAHSTSRHNLTSVTFQDSGIPNAFLLIILKFPSFSLLSWLGPLGSRKQWLYYSVYTVLNTPCPADKLEAQLTPFLFPSDHWRRWKSYCCTEVVLFKMVCFQLHCK